MPRYESVYSSVYISHGGKGNASYDIKCREKTAHTLKKCSNGFWFRHRNYDPLSRSNP
jgi:hypothetical protein